MAANFTFTPDYVIPEVPDFNTIITQSESMKKNYLSMNSTPVQRFKLIFKAIDNDDAIDIQAHYASCYGQYDNFSWTTVPSYIDTNLDGTKDGTNMTGRWVEGSLIFTPLDDSKCNVEIIFEKDV